MYSVDKVKLYIYGLRLIDVQEIMNNFSIDPFVTAYESHKVTSCRYNYTIKSNATRIFDFKIPNGVVYLGIEPNWVKGENRNFRDLIVEYNPNKVNLADVKQMQFMSWVSIEKIEIKSMDIALDLTLDITDLLVYKRHGNEYKATIEHSKLETIYLGRFGVNGHIKIYDKAKEQKEELIKWTRFEITYKNLGFMDIRDTKVIEETKLPSIFIINKAINLDDLKGIDKYLVLSSMENVELLNLLDRRKAKKIKEYHSSLLEQLDINLDEIIKVYKDFKII